MSTPPPSQPLPSYTPAGGESVPMAAPPQKKSNTLWWILGGCGCITLLILAIVAVVVFFVGGVFSFTQGPRDSVNTFITALQDGDCEEAKSVVHPDELGSGSCSGFTMLSDELNSNGDLDYSITSTSIENNTAEVDVDLTFTSKSGTERNGSATFTLEKSDGEWYIVDTDTHGTTF